MWRDVIIGIGLGVLTVFTMVLGGYLTSTKPLHRWSFYLSGLLMLVLIVAQTYRTASAQRELSRILGKIERNTEQPPKLEVNVPPPPLPIVKSKGFLELEPQWLQTKIVADAPLTLNLFFTNKGQEPIAGVYHYGVAGPVTAEESPITVHEELLKRAGSEYRKELHSRIPGTTVSVGRSIWNGPLGIASLSQEQYTKLKNGSLRFYVFGWAHWNNAVSDLDECVWLKIPDDDDLSQPNKLVWRDCIQPTLAPH